MNVDNRNVKIKTIKLTDKVIYTGKPSYVLQIYNKCYSIVINLLSGTLILYMQYTLYKYVELLLLTDFRMFFFLGFIIDSTIHFQYFNSLINLRVV